MHEHSCPELVTAAAGRCEGCRRAAEQRRGTAAQRGYDPRWARRRAAFLMRNPICVLCSLPATVADHYPDSRRALLMQQVRDPDADHRLRPLCKTCHDRSTALEQPGGFNIRHY